MRLSYELWDVFTDEALRGNPLAVVLEAEGLRDAQMQAVAREFNLSETSFLLPSAVADVRARFFTPTQELPMAGHPSVGTVYALNRLGRLGVRESVTLELGIGPVRMRLEREGDGLKRVWMNQGVPNLLEVYEDRGAVASALGLAEGDLGPDLPVQLGSAGVPFLYVPVVSLGALGRANVTLDALSALMDGDHKAVFVFTRNTPGADVRARMLGAAVGVMEDPATGSAHGPLGAYLAAHGGLEFRGGAARFVSHQGVEMGRKSELYVEVLERPAGYEVHVGGSAVRVGEGTLFL